MHPCVVGDVKKLVVCDVVKPVEVLECVCVCVPLCWVGGGVVLWGAVSGALVGVALWVAGVSSVSWAVQALWKYHAQCRFRSRKRH